MFRALPLAVLIAAMTSASPAIDWPVPGTRTLEVAALGLVVHVPAPVWIEKAVHEEHKESETNVTETWRVPAGLDMTLGELVVELSARPNWTFGFLNRLSGFAESCADTVTGRVKAGDPKMTVQLSYALCGRDHGTGQGGMLFGLVRRAEGDVALNVWYETPLEPFDAHDEASWPMSKADMEATTKALDAAITTTKAP